MKPGNLTIFVDESGSPVVYNGRGLDLLAGGQTSNYCVMAAIRTTDPASLRQCIKACIGHADAKYGTGTGRARVAQLHASDDRPALRQHVCDELAKLPIKAKVIAMDKRMLDPARTWRTDRTLFYNEMAAMLVADSLHLHSSTRLIFSHKNHDGAIDLNNMIAAVARRWQAQLGGTKVPRPTNATGDHKKPGQEIGLQAVDYIAWAAFRAFEYKDMTYLNALGPIVSHVWDLAHVTHYTRKSPMQTPPV